MKVLQLHILLRMIAGFVSSLMAKQIHTGHVRQTISTQDTTIV